MGDFWKPTAEMYSSLLSKPKMAEQLLKKPPFKYLFDIITETTKATGFGKGLLTEQETTADYYQSRERKIAYLQKFIDLIKVMGNEDLKVNPGKIVAGLQPEHTNSMLQSLYKLAVSGNPSDPYVNQVLGGGAPQVKPQKKEEKPKQKSRDAKETKEIEKKQDVPPPPQQNARVIRPPSAPRRGQRPSGQTSVPQKGQVPSRQGDREDQKQQIQPPSQRQIKQVQKQTKKQPQNYSKKVQDAIQQNQQVKQQPSSQQPVKKVQMGNLRKRKNQSRTQDAGSIGAVGQINQKQLESVKALIQSICQNSTPLSKSIEFINDDVEAMNQQLNYWRKQYNVSKNKMQNQLKTTQDALVPLYDKLAQIDEQIKDQKSKIQNTKSQIIKNQSTINALLYSVVKG